MSADASVLIDALTGGAISLPIALLAWRFGRITAAGAAVGLACGAIAYAGLLLAGLLVLGTALLLALASTYAGRRIGRVATDDGDDQRGARNVAANCLAGVAGSVAALAGLRFEVAAIWFVAGIAAGASDTVASEIGKAFGGVPRAFPGGQRVAPGTPGAVSARGTLAGAVAAAIIAAPAAALWLISWHGVGVVVVACTLASLVESALATALEARGRIGNHTLNLINTVIAATIAAAWTAGAIAWRAG